MWGPLRLITFSLSTQTAVGQLKFHVLGIRHFTPDGSVLFYPSGKAASGFNEFLQTAKADDAAENGGGWTDIPQAEGDVAIQSFDHGRELGVGVRTVVMFIVGLIDWAKSRLELRAELTKKDADSTTLTGIRNVNAQGDVTINFVVNNKMYFNDDGTSLCDTCGISVTAGGCVSNCPKNTENIVQKIKDELILKTFGDPHMKGVLGQKFDWSGQDMGWYSLVSDGEDFQLNVRVTAPMPEDFPDRQLVSAVSILSPGGRSFVIEVKNPYTTSTVGCGSGCGFPLPCLADGALRFIVDGAEHRGLQMPGQAVELPRHRFVSSANLPAECRPFGGDRIWAAQCADMIKSQRSLRGNEEEFEEWILKEGNMAPTWCAKFLQEEGLPGLLAVQSNHAVFHVVTPSTSLRINFGVNHQDRVTSEDGATVLVPELTFWQGDVGVERSSVSDNVSGMLGETSRPVLDEHGVTIMEGISAIRGTPEDYRVDGPFGVQFDLLGHEVVSS